MKEIGIWTDEAREIALQAFLDAQKHAWDGFYFVPYKTAMVLYPNGLGTAFSHIGGDQQPPSTIQRFSFPGSSKSNLMTSGLYECGGVSISIAKQAKVLIHAHGPHSLDLLLSQMSLALSETIGLSIDTNARFDLFYRTREIKNAIGYEVVANKFCSQFRGIAFYRHWVDETHIVSC